MPHERKGGAAAAVAGRVFVVGGIRRDGEYLREVDIYDPASDAWSTVSSAMPTRRWMPTASAVEGKVVVVGGASFDQGMKYATAVEVYDFATGSRP